MKNQRFFYICQTGNVWATGEIRTKTKVGAKLKLKRMYPGRKIIKLEKRFYLQ